jgi:hypothetical protein
VQSDRSILYVDGIIRVVPGATVPLHRIDTERRSFTIRWPPQGHPPPVSPDAEIWALSGKETAAPGIHVLLEWPGILQPLASLMNGLDGLYSQLSMVEVIKNSSDDPERAWLEAKVAAEPYVTDGHTTQLFSWVMPTLHQEGEHGVLDELSRRGRRTFRSFEEAQRSQIWQEVMTRPVPITWVWEAVGLFWALLLEKLERNQIRCCQRCGRILEGTAQKTFCGREDNVACCKARLRENRHRERIHERRKQKGR